MIVISCVQFIQKQAETFSVQETEKRLKYK